jgi:hypothetical protein
MVIQLEFLTYQIIEDLKLRPIIVDRKLASLSFQSRIKVVQKSIKIFRSFNRLIISHYDKFVRCIEILRAPPIFFINHNQFNN